MRPCPAIRAALVLTVIPVMLVTADWAAAAVQEVVTGLSRPVRLVAPVGDDRLFVVQRTGEIRIFDQQGIELGTFLDISDSTTNFSERGLLGLAFPPDFATNPRVIINHTDPDGHTRIVRYTVSAANPDSLDPATREVLLTVQQPYGNHNGGHLEFGSDGMLYIGLGDGGASGDSENRAQDDTTLLGKMLRIDVSPPVGYAVPPDNPHVGEAPLDEIWAKGLRNPWCFSFDSGTGDLYIATSPTWARTCWRRSTSNPPVPAAARTTAGGSWRERTASTLRRAVTTVHWSIRTTPIPTPARPPTAPSAAATCTGATSTRG